MKPYPPKPFDIAEWTRRNLPEAYHSQAVKLLNGCDLAPDQVNEIFQLGRSTQRVEDEAELKEYTATISGLTNALAAKNEAMVTVKNDRLTPALLFLLFAAELYRILLQP